MKAAILIYTPVSRLNGFRPVIIMSTALLLSSLVVSLPSAFRTLFSKIQPTL